MNEVHEVGAESAGADRRRPVGKAGRAEDGRRSRWTEHRRARRVEFVGAALTAVRSSGPDFSVDDVARVAGVSKTVLYRYFADKDELVDAVLDRISGEVLLPELMGALLRDGRDDLATLRAVIGTFVTLTEQEPALYRFAYAHTGRAGGADLVAATERQVADALSATFGQRLQEQGRSPDAAATWAYGIVGMVQLSVHWWSTARHVPAQDLVDQLTALAWGGLSVQLPARGDVGARQDGARRGSPRA